MHLGPRKTKQDNFPTINDGDSQQIPMIAFPNGNFTPRCPSLIFQANFTTGVTL